MNTLRQRAATGLWILGTILVLALSVLGNGIWWKNHDGAEGTTADTWDALQGAITSAQGGSGGQRGWVKICSSITRTSTAQGGQLAVTNSGNVTLGGGWTWNGGSEPTARSGRSRLDVNAQPSALNDDKRVVYVNATNVTLDSLILVNGYLSTGRGGGVCVDTNSHFFTITNAVVENNRAGWWAGGGGHGGGVYVLGKDVDYLKSLRVTRCVITNNTAVSWGRGGGIYVQNAGQSAYPTIIESSDISFNVTWPNYGSSSGGGMDFVNVGKTVVANCTVVSNRAVLSGSGINVQSAGADRPRVTVFGCLVVGNRWDSGPTVVSSVYAYGYNDADALLLANTTVADNGEVGHVLVPCSHYGGAAPPLRTCNTIVSDSDAYLYLTQDRGDTRAQVNLQHSTFNLAPTGYYAECTSGGTTNWMTLADAVASKDLNGYYRFHSLNAANAQTQNPEGNLQGDPGFIGTGRYPYAPDPTNTNALARVIDQGLQFTSSNGYVYLDVNVNGAYDALTDIIVDLNGQPHPGAGHFVYTKDLAGNRRVRPLTPRGAYVIDRGPYEYQHPSGTVVFLR